MVHLPNVSISVVSEGAFPDMLDRSGFTVARCNIHTAQVLKLFLQTLLLFILYLTVTPLLQFAMLKVNGFELYKN